jgi:DNA polymerase III sliding clamp (beta) subunit (PCNA family)
LKTNIEIPVTDLKSVLPGFAKVVSKRASLPVLGCVKITLNPNHTLEIQANNLDQIVTARLDKTYQGTPGALLVPFDELNSTAKLCSASDSIELSASGKESFITYPAAGTRIKKPVEHLGAEEFPPATEVNTEPIKLDDAFKVALREALDCASEDQTRYLITVACLDVRNKEAHYVVGTNGHHLVAANSFLFDVPQSIIVPPGKFLTWPGFIDDGPWTLRFQPEVKGKGKTAAKPAWVRIDSNHWTYVAKPIEGEFPNWKQIVPAPDDSKSQVVLSEQGITTILEALPLLPGQDAQDRPITLEITKDELFLKAKGRSGGDWTSIPIPAQVSGLPVSISLNRAYLAKALRFGCIRIEIKDDGSPLMFSIKGKTFVVSPLRPPGAAVQAPAPKPISPASENASATAPSLAEPPPQTENERTNMPAKVTPMTAPQRGNLTGTTAPEAETSAIDKIIKHIDTVKTNLRDVLDDLKEIERLCDQAVKEKKAGDKDIMRARNALRSLQSVEL